LLEFVQAEKGGEDNLLPRIFGVNCKFECEPQNLKQTQKTVYAVSSRVFLHQQNM
jgi:hypothetical protein